MSTEPRSVEGYQEAANVANLLIGLAVKNPVAAAVAHDFVRLFAEKIELGESWSSAAQKSAELAVSEALLRARV
jgi:hypothetical protein